MAPPPAATDAAVEQLCRNFHLYSSNLHVLIVPRLMTSRLRKQLKKVADLFVENFEPLTLAIVLPFASQSPWKLRYITFVSDCNRSLQTLLKDDPSMGSDSLRKLLLSAMTLESLPGNVVREMLRGVKKERHRVVRHQEEDGFDLTSEENKLSHLVARNGDQLMFPFQCDLCYFRNIGRIDPKDYQRDLLLLMTIRRVNVDAFWSREPSSVEATRRDSKTLLAIGERVGIDVLPAMGPFPLKDTQGMSLEVSILLRSLDKGRCFRSLYSSR